MPSEKLKKYRSPLIAQMYALVAWSGKTLDEAQKMVDDILDKNNNQVCAYKQLDEIVFANDSIKTAYEEVKKNKNLLKDKTEEEKFDIVVDMLEKIHDTWVLNNSKKFDRGNLEKSEKMLFQHLPLALIGIKETAKDAMFLAPFLENVGIHIGDMSNTPYGEFVCCEPLVEAYNRKVEKFKSAYNIKSKDDLRKNLKTIIKDYAPLHEDSKYKEARLNFMNEELDNLAIGVVKKHDNNTFTKHIEKEASL